MSHRRHLLQIKKHLQAHYSPHLALIHPRPLLPRFLTLCLQQ